MFLFSLFFPIIPTSFSFFLCNILILLIPVEWNSINFRPCLLSTFWFYCLDSCHNQFFIRFSSLLPLSLIKLILDDNKVKCLLTSMSFDSFNFAFLLDLNLIGNLVAEGF